jgi:hypothetical protein
MMGDHEFMMGPGKYKSFWRWKWSVDPSAGDSITLDCSEIG